MCLAQAAVMEFQRQPSHFQIYYPLLGAHGMQETTEFKGDEAMDATDSVCAWLEVEP